ncbi:MAG: FAD:protein FMN transferase [Planctomycetaceae bacterium]|jgi:thiamine biosynthesis lipoprotein|nr:FAD:protein FMN transferase [Planctomycetaceae bacterium]
MNIAVSRKAMNDAFEVTYPRDEYPQGTAAALDALDEVERIESKLSVFRFGSRIQYVNLTAHEAPVHLDDELFALISLCRQIAEDTGGAVDVTSGKLWKIWGFAQRDGRIPTDDELRTARSCTGYHLLELDTEEKTVRFKKAGVELNFGCVGKGFALDIATAKLAQHGVGRYLFQGGLSSILAKGDWNIGIAHPLLAGERLQELPLNNTAVSTSGSQKQYFRYNGKRYSHLLDPRSGEPAAGVLSVTVTAPTAVLAELLSTAFFVFGPEKTQEYIDSCSDITAVMCVPEKQAPGFSVHRYAAAEH